jgi:hypothetical protein
LPTTEERLEAVERIEQVAQELRTVIKNTKPIDYAKAYGLAKEKAWSIRNTWNNFDRFGLRQFETKSNPVAGTFRREKIELARAWFHWCPTVTQDLTTSDNWQSMKLTTAEEVFQGGGVYLTGTVRPPTIAAGKIISRRCVRAGR